MTLHDTDEKKREVRKGFQEINRIAALTEEHLEKTDRELFNQALAIINRIDRGLDAPGPG